MNEVGKSGVEEIEGVEPSSRRKFLAQAGAVTGALTMAAVPGSALAKKRAKRKRKRKKKKKFYALSASAPFHQCAPGRPSCVACNACIAHSASKLFPTPEAANTHRAHPNCRCGVIEVGKIKKKKYVKLFGPASNRLQVVDRRNANVARILAQ